MPNYLNILLRIAICLFLGLSSGVFAQKDTIKYDISLSGLSSTGKESPFWLHSRDYGITSSTPQSAGLILGINKEFKNHPTLFDYGFGAKLLLKTDNLTSNAYFHELFAKVRFSFLDLIIGSREEHPGNQDSSLSSGGLLFSQNARPMPKITIGIEHFVPIPFTYGYVEIKGALTHGWFNDNSYVQGELLHHKYACLKLGGRLPVHLQLGLDHVAQWGGTVPGYGAQTTGFKDYLTVFLGRSGGTGGELINALGNHIISQSVRMDADISDFKIAAYWQNISEDGPIRLIGFTMNATDGLWGVSLRNKKFPYIQAIVYEYLNTDDQSGPYHDKDGIVYGGGDSYFTNYIYQSGWSYFSKTIGTPFILPQLPDNTGFRMSRNNRIQLHHVGIEGDVSSYAYRLLGSFSKNYGTFGVPFSPMIHNTSLLLELNKSLPKVANIHVGCKIAADFGELYGNSLGFQLSVRKSGNLFNY